MSFTVWESKKDIYIIDGHHRYKVLDLLEKEGINVPVKLPCTFIDCKDKREACKLVLTYSSIYAKVQEEGLYEFLNVNKFDFESLKAEIDIPNIDFEKFEMGYFKEQDSEVLNDVPALQDKAVSKLGDLFLIDGKHRVLCGDSTKEETIKILLDGNKIDLVFADPPYGIEAVNVKNKKVGGGGATHFGKVGGGNIVESNTYREIIGDKTIETAKRFYDVCLKLNFKNIVLWGGNYFTNFLSPSRCWFVWDKEMTGNFSEAEMAWTSFEKGGIRVFKHLWNGLSREGNRKDELSKRVHPTQKPVGLFKQIFLRFDYLKNIFDGFLGSGSTLIACEQTNRVLYGIELDEHYIDVILRRYKKLYPDSKFECLNRKFDFKELFKAVS